MTTHQEMSKINDAAQALLKSKIDPANIDFELSSNKTEKPPKPTPIPKEMIEQSLKAVRSGDLKQIRFLSNHIEGFTKIRDGEGMPLLHVAVSVDNLNVMDLLVVIGCNLNGLDSRGGTAVLEAASVGSLRGLKWLVKSGITGGAARPDARGDTTMHLASGKGRVHMMDWLLEQGCDLEAKTMDFKARPLQYAICHDREDAVRWLVRKGADLHAMDNAYGWNSLHIAAANGRSNICELLVKRKPDLLTVRSKDATKLHLLPENIAFRNGNNILSNRLKKKRIAYERTGGVRNDEESKRLAAEAASRRLLDSLDQEKINSNGGATVIETKKKKKKKRKKKKKPITATFSMSNMLASNSATKSVETEMPVPTGRLMNKEDMSAFETVSKKKKKSKNSNSNSNKEQQQQQQRNISSKRNRSNSGSQRGRSSSPTEENKRLGEENGTVSRSPTNQASKTNVHTTIATINVNTTTNFPGPPSTTIPTALVAPVVVATRSKKNNKSKIKSKKNKKKNKNKDVSATQDQQQKKQQNNKQTRTTHSKLSHISLEAIPAPIATVSPPTTPRSSPPSTPERRGRLSRGSSVLEREHDMNPRAPSWSPTKREPWKAGSLGGKIRNQRLRKSWDKTSMEEPDSIRRQRFSADTTLEELEELDIVDDVVSDVISTPENTQSEFDRLLKRYVHMDPQAMKAARKRFAKRILDQMNTPSSYTLHFKKDKKATDGARDVPERIRGASWASDADTSDDEEEEEEERMKMKQNKKDQKNMKEVEEDVVVDELVAAAAAIIRKDEEKQEPKRTASPLMSRRPRTNSRSTSPKLKDLDGVGVEGPGEECDDWQVSKGRKTKSRR